jgi:hypothetical protein
MSSRVEIDEAGFSAFEKSIVDACDMVIVSVAVEAIDRAAKRTGAMARSVDHSGNAHTGYQIFADAGHAAYVERGTEKFDAEPFLRPSIHIERIITQG